MPGSDALSKEDLKDLAPGSPRFRVGDLVGDRYQLLECIGVGAMGAVFRAHDRVLDAELAMKLIRLDPERADNERATRRLLQEARAIARISHPGIVRVFDFGCVGNVPFIAMELLHGETLLEGLMRDGKFEPTRAARTLLPIADALCVAHRRKVVHRDIKPENVFVAKDEFGRLQPKLVDFGVARLREAGSVLTRPGALMGTPDYMAPEQAQAEPDVDHRADVWAFAILLYEMITMRRPFSDPKQSSYLAVLKAIVSEPPRPLADHGVHDEALWRILTKALQKSRDDRWQDLRQMGAALAEWLLNQGIVEDACGSSLRAVWLSGDPALPPIESRKDSDLESITLIRLPASPAAAADEDEDGTLPPPAMVTPPLLDPPVSHSVQTVPDPSQPTPAVRESPAPDEPTLLSADQGTTEGPLESAEQTSSRATLESAKAPAAEVTLLSAQRQAVSVNAEQAAAEAATGTAKRSSGSVWPLLSMILFFLTLSVVTLLWLHSHHRARRGESAAHARAALLQVPQKRN